MAKSRGAVYMKPKRIIGIAARISNGVSVTQNKNIVSQDEYGDMEIGLKEFWSNLYVKVNPDKYDIRGIYKKKNLKSNNTKVFDIDLVDIQRGEKK